VPNSRGAVVSYALPTKSQSIALTANATGLTAVTYSETALAGPSTAISVSGGNNQTGPPSTMLKYPPVAGVTDKYGNPVANASVTFSDAGAGGTFSANPVLTGVLGKAKVSYTTPPTTGTVNITAKVGGVATPATFTETVK